MDHELAVRSNAVERYVLGDLPLVEVEDFERHFFECSQCSEELRTLSILAGNLRAVLSEEAIAPTQVIVKEPVIEEPPVEVPRVVHIPATPRVEKIPWWRSGWTMGPSFAAVAFAILAGYQALIVVPGLKQQMNRVEGIETFAIRSATRGDEIVIAPSKGPSVYTLEMDKVSDSEVGSFHGVVRDEAGVERYSFDVKNPGLQHPVSVKIPATALKSGRYVLTLEGGGTTTYPFTVHIE